MPLWTKDPPLFKIQDTQETHKKYNKNVIFLLFNHIRLSKARKCAINIFKSVAAGDKQKTTKLFLISHIIFQTQAIFSR